MALGRSIGSGFSGHFLSHFIIAKALQVIEVLAMKQEIGEDQQQLNGIIDAINKQLGEGSIMRLGSTTRMNVSALPTGALALDLALGVGGLPRGRVCEIFGPESSGKTTFCLSVIAEAQKRGGNAVFVDVEHALDSHYAKIVGVDLENLIISQPECGEDALQITETLIRSGALDVVVLDSVAALVSRAELSGQMGDVTVGAQARLMGQAMRRLTAAISRSRCVCIFTNQIREKIGVSFGSPETTPGGRALKFFSSVRLDIRRIGQIKGADGRICGNRTRVKVVKNKVAPPFRECEFDILYSEGISRIGSIFDLAIEHDLLQKKGSWISHEGNLIGQGREAAKQFLLQNSDVTEGIEKLLRQRIMLSGGVTIGENGSVISPELEN